jgi:hypothetical protein
MSAQAYAEIESKPKDIPVLAGPFGTGYVDRDELLLPPKGLTYGQPIPSPYGTALGYEVHDRDGHHLGWFVPSPSGGSFMTDAEAKAASLIRH